MFDVRADVQVHRTSDPPEAGSTVILYRQLLEEFVRQVGRTVVFVFWSGQTTSVCHARSLIPEERMNQRHGASSLSTWDGGARGESLSMGRPELSLDGEGTIERLPHGFFLRSSALDPASSTTDAVAFAIATEPGSTARVGLSGKAGPSGRVVLALALASAIVVAILEIRLATASQSGPAAATATSCSSPPSTSAPLLATPWDAGSPTVAIPLSGGFLPNAVLSASVATDTTSTAPRDGRPRPTRRSRKAPGGVRKPKAEPSHDETARALAVLGRAQLESGF
jgi:hypothetical protein